LVSFIWFLSLCCRFGVRTILLLLVLGIGHAITSFSCMLQDAAYGLMMQHKQMHVQLIT
jgi:hypothetical protein